MKLRIKVAEGFKVPPWYGFAWSEPHLGFAVCFLIPLNLPVRWAIRFYRWVKFGKGRGRL